jgi:hypothetical protein
MQTSTSRFLLLESKRYCESVTAEPTAACFLTRYTSLWNSVLRCKPLTLQGSDYAHAVNELNKAIDRAEGLMVQ